MTYPPQQPDPGGWGRRAAEDADEDAPESQQQPAFYGNQHAGLPKGPITGNPAQPGQQPFPPPQHAQFGGPQPSFPPAPDWENFGAQDREPFPDIEAEPRGRRRLPWVLGGAGVLVVAAAVVGGLLLFGGDDPGEPRPVAQDMVDKVNAGDFGALGSSLCESNRAELDQQLGQLSQGRFELRLGPVTAQGRQARAELTGTYELDGARIPVAQALLLEVEDGRWKVCRLGAR
ncbi:hypothetical protein INP57_09325 [Saccharopolyspora sp. HNM0986]|uniref:Rv0361 family membrane protein n=1 Tax=Saccharopolyspora galaxeae TaxID=2781241 RepID=UPI00190BEC91|nr:hypothetical protein [Saccharopolyspora sp. HNM0986]MBK0867006.1 hypothetical protein [Saccharopolyspora sp. HNM0986]